MSEVFQSDMNCDVQHQSLIRLVFSKKGENELRLRGGMKCTVFFVCFFVPWFYLLNISETTMLQALSM